MCEDEAALAGGWRLPEGLLAEAWLAKAGLAELGLAGLGLTERGLAELGLAECGCRCCGLEAEAGGGGCGGGGGAERETWQEADEDGTGLPRENNSRNALPTGATAGGGWGRTAHRWRSGRRPWAGWGWGPRTESRRRPPAAGCPHPSLGWGQGWAGKFREVSPLQTLGRGEGVLCAVGLPIAAHKPGGGGRVWVSVPADPADFLLRRAIFGFRILWVFPFCPCRRKNLSAPKLLMVMELERAGEL